MHDLYDTIAEILTELYTYGTADHQTVKSFIDSLNNHDDETGVNFEVDQYGVVDYTEVY